MDAKKDNLEELEKMKDILKDLLHNQQELKKELQMVFSDITHFENMVLKILDQTALRLPKEDLPN